MDFIKIKILKSEEAKNNDHVELAQSRKARQLFQSFEQNNR